MCSCVQDVPMKWFLKSLVIYCNMAIYCNTLEGNTQYGDDPYCFTPNRYTLFLLVLIGMGNCFRRQHEPDTEKIYLGPDEYIEQQIRMKLNITDKNRIEMLKNELKRITAL